MTTIVFNVNEICRVCMVTNKCFINIFLQLETNFSIINTLMECAPVEICEEDGLPTKICTECLYKLKIYLNLKNQIIQSDATFRQNLQNNTDVKPCINSNGNVSNYPYTEFVSIDSTKHGKPSEVHIKEENVLDITIKDETIDCKNPLSLEGESNEEKNIKKPTKNRSKPKKIDPQINESEPNFNTEDNQPAEDNQPTEDNQPSEEKDLSSKEENISPTDKKKKIKRKRKPKTEKEKDKPKNKIKCDQCEKTFDTKYRLNFHQRGHTGEKLFLCDLCGKSFTWNNDFQKHQKQHNNEFSFQCEFCSKRFVKHSDFQEHHRTHLDERAFKCDICDKAFKQQSCLRLHKEIHAGIKKFQCDICEKRFLRKYVLTRHKRMHTGERPYECMMCNKTFPHDSGLFRHNKVIHNINSIKSSNVRILKTDSKSEQETEASIKNKK